MPGKDKAVLAREPLLSDTLGILADARKIAV
jgi:hypothetical protein